MIGKAYNAGLFLLNTAFGIYIWVLLLRVILQWVRADFYNPISQLVWHVTRIPVTQMQVLIPRWRRLDIAACLYIYLVAWAYIGAYFWFIDQPVSLNLSLLLALREVALQLLSLYTASLVVFAIMSWIGPGFANPAGAILWSVNEPLLRPIRRVLPPYAGLDFSPMIAILLLQLVRILAF